MDLRTQGRRGVGLATLAIVLFAMPAIIGCGDGGSSPSTAAPAAAPPPPATVSYADTVRPLTDELTRMRLLLATKDGADRAQFAKQFREVQFQHAKVAPVLSETNRALDSWGHVDRAMELLRQVQAGLDRIDGIARGGEPAPSGGPAGPSGRLPSTDPVKQAMKDVTDVAILREEVPRLMGEAGAQVLLMEQDLRAGK